MSFSIEERVRRYLRLAERADAAGRRRHARIFRRMAMDLSSPTD